MYVFMASRIIMPLSNKVICNYNYWLMNICIVAFASCYLKDNRCFPYIFFICHSML